MSGSVFSVFRIVGQEEEDICLGYHGGADGSVRLELMQGDCREVLPTLEARSVQCCVTSPPYWGLRDYGTDAQLGLESTPEEYIANMLAVFREVWRVLRDDGTLWVNMGDSYASDTKGSGGTQKSGLNAKRDTNGYLADDRHAHPTMTVRKLNHGLKSKDLCGIPWRLAFALQADGWYLRSDIIWHKPNPMPESVTDRPTKAHEYIFLLSKQERYFYDVGAIKEPSTYTGPQQRQKRGEFNGKTEALPGLNAFRAVTENRNKRTVWTVPAQPYSEAHFATFPEDLIKPCILAGSRVGDTVLDPFGGSGTVGKVAIECGRSAVLIELNPQYVELARERTNVTAGFF
jgi:DNA modification methylase